MLHGRERELARLSGLAADVRAGGREVLTLRGEPGIGLSALLDRVALERMPVIRGHGVRQEANLELAGLHRILGIEAGADRLRTGTRVAALLAEHARNTGLLVLVDDAQWIDDSTADVLLFAARRTVGAGVGLIFAVADAPVHPRRDRLGSSTVLGGGLPRIRPGRLGEAEAGRIVDDRVAELPPRVRTHLVEIAGGNPGALVALTLALTAEQRAGRLVSPWAPLESIAVSPPPVSAGTRAVLAILAVLGAADLTEIMPVAARIGGSMANLAEAERAALITVTGTTVAFSHPLARIAAYAAAPLAVRAAAHLAVAEGSDSRKDTLGWHRATAALAPKEATAAVLAAAAGDLGAEEAADALQRAAELTPDPDRRAARLGLAAAAAREAGQRTRAVALVYESHLPAMAWSAAWAVVAGLEEVRLRVLAGQCVPARAQAERLARDCRRGELYGRLPEVLEVIAACHIGAGRYRDADTCAREGLSWAARSGDGVGAARLSAVRAWVAAVTGGDVPPGTGEDESSPGAGAAVLREEDGSPSRAEAAALREGDGSSFEVEAAALREWARSAGYAASGEWERVLERPLPDGVLAVLAAPDHVEAAVRLGDRAGAIAVSLRLEKAAALIGAPWADTLVTRSRMLIAGGSAEPPPREGHPFDRARAALSYGELLRKARRRGEARPWLTEALECFERLGAAPWAARAAAELAACGSPASTAAQATGSGDDVVARAGLTPQELRIVRLAARGAVNREIAVTLALSPRTVGFHLYRAFRKLGVSTRAELAGLVPPDHL